MNRFHDIDCDSESWKDRSIFWKPTLEQLTDDGQADGIPAISAEEWAAQNEAKVAAATRRVPRRFRGKGASESVPVECVECPSMRWSSIGRAAAELGVDKGSISKSVVKGWSVRGGKLPGIHVRRQGELSTSPN